MDFKVCRNIIILSVLAAAADNLAYAFFTIKEFLFSASARSANALIAKTVEENEETSKEIMNRLQTIQGLQSLLEKRNA